MDPDEVFSTLKEHASQITRVDVNNTALRDYVHGSDEGQFPDGHELPEGCLELRLQRLEKRISYLEKQNTSLRQKLAWAVRSDDNSQQP